MASHLVTNEATGCEDLVDVLAHKRRRQAIKVLQDAETPLSLSNLAVRMARQEQATTEGEPTGPERIEAMLHHVHLPKLEDSGVVVYEYSDDRKRVTFTGTPEQTEALLDQLAL